MLKDVITADMINGVFTEIISLIPIVLPVSIGFMGVRKAYSFLMGMLRSA